MDSLAIAPPVTEPRPVTRVRGWRLWRMVAIWTYVGIGLTLGLAAAYVARNQITPALVLFALTPAVLVISLGMIKFWRDSIREVIVEDSRVLLITGRGETPLAWSQICPFRRPPSEGEVLMEYMAAGPDSPENRRYLWITRNQARAILAHPSCPPETQGILDL